jgi:hypothetical protein
VWYQVSGWLHVKPIAAPVTTGQEPAITGYRTLAGAPISEAAPGQRFLVIGSGFGPGGEVFVDGGLAPRFAWADSRIEAAVPEFTVRALGQSSVTVMRSDGAYYTGLAFRVVAP